MAHTTIVISQGQSANPIKRQLEEDLVAALLFEQGVEVTVVPHLYDLASDSTGMLCLQSITGNVVVLSWLFPRAAYWTLDRNGVRGRFGRTLLTAEADADDEAAEDAAQQAADKARVLDGRPPPNRTIYCLDLRAQKDVAPFVEEIRRIAREQSLQTVELLGWIQGAPQESQLQRFVQPANNNHETTSVAAATPPVTSAPAAVRIAEEPARRWYPVIDYSRCTNCMECIDFCLFGVYGVDRVETILVEQPDNCRKGCPACSRVCPENAIIFPQHKAPEIAGSSSGGEVGGLKIDLSKLFGAPDPLAVAVLERDVELVAVGRDAVGATVGIPRRQSQASAAPKDELDALIDQLDEFGL